MVERVTLYMKLLDEDVEVWRPVDVEPLPNKAYRVLGPVPERETWEFEPGAIVFGEERVFSGGERGVAAVGG